MDSQIKDTHRRIDINDVRDVVVTEVVAAEGRSMRSIRIMGEPIVNNKPTEIMEIVLSSENASDIELAAPGFEY